MPDNLLRCMTCSKWTNYGLTCINCSPKALDKTTSRDEEPDPYYEEYKSIEVIDEEFFDEDELED